MGPISTGCHWTESWVVLLGPPWNDVIQMNDDAALLAGMRTDEMNVVI